jgi:Flp pilus assembly protein protease CpaA
LQLAAVVAGVLMATLVDLRTRRIPNALTVTMAAFGLALAATGAGGQPLWASAAGLALGFALMMPGHVRLAPETSS